MGVRLSIEVISPLDADDHDLLTGIAVMTLAIANHEMAKARFPETFFDDDEDEGDGRDTAAASASTTPSEPVPERTARATRAGTTAPDDGPSRGGKGEVWPPDPRRGSGRRS